MTKKIDAKEWAEEFQNFLDTPGERPPQDAKQEVMRVVHRDLHPPLWLVLAKLGGIHVLGGSLSLLICTQFDLGRGYNLMHLFMHKNILECMVLCGAIFLCLTLVLAGFFLSQPELKKIRQAVYTPVVLLGIMSLLVFIGFGAEIALTLAIFWLLGAITAGAVLTEISLGIRHFAHTPLSLLRGNRNF